MIVHVNEAYFIINYLIAVIVSVVIALGLKLPLLPRKPIRFSFDKSALFPTPIFAIGFLALCFSTGFFGVYDGMVLAVFWGVVSALFVKFALDCVFPKPPGGKKEDVVNE